MYGFFYKSLYFCEYFSIDIMMFYINYDKNAEIFEIFSGIDSG
ncbi:hypothetical protein AGMMS50249_3710 [candidate division SR1 bacterium]|nr:hypothetical protein AGMMS50249_3710 [candidate division SR1 bacterium]